MTVFVFALMMATSIAHAQDASSTPAPSPAASVPAATPSATRKIVGVLRERGTKTRMSGVNVFILPHKLKATTNARGEFEFPQVPAGEIEFVVNQTSYEKLDKKIDLSDDIEVKLYLEKISYQSYETTITDKAQREDVVVKTLSREVFLTLPGANGDPVKAVQNLPGVARTGGFSSSVIIQGSAPEDTQYFVDGLNVPIVFHFGGLTSVIMPEAIDSVDYLSAGYGPEYGRALGGILGLNTKEPATDRLKGIAFMDTEKAGLLLEGPIDDKSSLLVSGRYSYLGLVLAAALKGNSSLDLTVAPAFWDSTLVYKNNISGTDNFKFTGLTSHDELGFVFKQPVKTDPSVRGTFDDQTTFYRLIPQWNHKFSEDLKSNVSLGVGRDWVLVDFGQNYFDLSVLETDMRANIEEKFSDNWTSILGIDALYSDVNYAFQLPNFSSQGGVRNPISSGQVVTAGVHRDDIDPAIYWKNTIKPTGSDWSYLPSLRVDYFHETNQTLAEPRIAARYKISDSLGLKGATGIYYQPPQAQEIDAIYGNPNLTAEKAYHVALGVEKDFREGHPSGFTLTTGPFYRDFENLVISSSNTVVQNGVAVPEKYNNQGTGVAYGMEVLLKWDAKPWTGFLSYTLSKSTRTEPVVGSHLFEYDQTNNLILVAQKDDKNWKYSGRMRYVTGNPATPIVGGTFDSDNDVYLPARGGLYSTRLGSFFELDVRVDKKWIYDTWILSAYLDVENLTNAKNPESISYSYNYGQSATINDLPLLPTLGVQGEF